MQLKNFINANGKVVNIEIDNGINDVIDGRKEVYISSGWIDLHTHCYDKYLYFGDQIDEVGYKKGVCLVCDAGSVGIEGIDEFVEETKSAITNTKIWLNVSSQGLSRKDELSNLEWINEKQIIDTIHQYSNEIVGLKVRASQSVVGTHRDLPLNKTVEIANEVNKPVMVHLGSAPSDIETILNTLRKGDVITHLFKNNSNGILNHSGNIKKCINENKGKIWYDLGHGSEGFSYEICQKALVDEFKCDSISSDNYRRVRTNGPVYSLGATMSKLLEMGYSLQEVVDGVTTIPMQILNMKDFKDNYTLFKIIEGTWILPDSYGQYRQVHRLIRPVGVVVNGKYYYLEEPREWQG